MTASNLLKEKNKPLSKNVKWMSVAIQCLIIICAMVLNFLIPVVYGVEAYGKFIQANILIFVIQKFTDIVVEPLIATVDPKYIFITTVLTSGLVLLIAQAINYFDHIGSQWLLASMLLSSNCMLAMFALKLQRQLMLHLGLLLLVFFGLLLCDQYGVMFFSIAELLTWANIVPATLSATGIFMHGAHFPSFEKLGLAIKISLRRFPGNVSLTLVFNCLTNIFPYIFAKQMSALDVGVFRIITSILQSATSLFPVNIKTIFIMLIESNRRSRQLRNLMIASVVYFSLIGIGATLLTCYAAKLTPYVEMITALPLIYWVVLLERYMQAAGIRIPLILINLAVGLAAIITAFFVKDLEQAKNLYALTLAVYLCALLASSQVAFARFKFYSVIVCSVFVLFIEPIIAGTALIYMCLLICATIVFTNRRLLEIMLLKN